MPLESPPRFDDSLCDFNRHDRPSAANKNKYGDIGSPCRIPRDGLNSSSLLPLNKTENFTEDRLIAQGGFATVYKVTITSETN